MEGNFNQAGDAGAFGGIIMLIIIGMIFYFAFAQFKIAQKLNHQNAWFAFVPILNTVQLIQLAGKPMIWFLGLLVPFVNIVLFAMLWIQVARATGYSAIVGFLTLIPPISLVTIGMMAFGGGSGSNSGGHSSVVPPPQQPTPQHPQSVG